MATRLTYNGVTLHNVTTRDFREEIVYDLSNTDRVGSRFFISVDGVIHNQRAPSPNNSLTDAIVYAAPGNVSATSNTASIYDRLYKMLSEPRKTLTFSVGASSSSDGDRVLTVAPSSLDPINGDTDNGPMPRKVDITSIIGSSVFRVRFDIEAQIGAFSGGQVVLSNRWSLRETMDENFFTERKIDGTLKLARSMFGPNEAGSIPAHVHKHLCIPVLETGFKRRTIDFGSEPDGLTCVYSVVDKQTHTAAPWPATKIDCKHTESMSDGVSFTSQVTVSLEGPPHIDKRLLIERCVQIADDRLEFIDEQSSEEATQSMEYAEIVDNIGDSNRVDFTMRIKQLRTDAEQLTRLLTGKLGTPLDLPADANYDPKLSPVPNSYGYDPHGGERRPAVLWVLHCYLQEPSTVHGINDNSLIRNDDDIPELTRSDTQVTEQPPATLSERQHRHYSQAATRAIYTMSKIKSEYGVNDTKVAMPYSIRPSSSTLATNVVLDLCAPQAWRVVEVDVERIGTPPEIGTPFPTYTDGTLVATRMKHDICIFPPMLSPDGRNPVYRVKARTYYSLNRPLEDGERVRIGVHPYTKDLLSALTLAAIYNDQLDPQP